MWMEIITSEGLLIVGASCLCF